MEMNRVDGMEMNCVICGERTEHVYDVHLPHDEVIITRLGLCDNDKEALAGLPSEERNAKLIEGDAPSQIHARIIFEKEIGLKNCHRFCHLPVRNIYPSVSVRLPRVSQRSDPP